MARRKRHADDAPVTAADLHPGDLEPVDPPPLDAGPSPDPSDVGAPMPHAHAHAPVAGFRVECVRNDWWCVRMLGSDEVRRTAHVSYARAEAEGLAWVREHAAELVTE